MWVSGGRLDFDLVLDLRGVRPQAAMSEEDMLAASFSGSIVDVGLSLNERREKRFEFLFEGVVLG